MDLSYQFSPDKVNSNQTLLPEKVVVKIPKSKDDQSYINDANKNIRRHILRRRSPNSRLNKEELMIERENRKVKIEK